MRAARIPATTASNRPDLLHRRAGQLLAARPTRGAVDAGRSKRPRPGPRTPRPCCTAGWWARAHCARGVRRMPLHPARRLLLRSPFRSPAAPVCPRRAPGGRTGPRGRWSPPRPAHWSGPVPRPAALACLARWPPQRRVAQPLARRQPQRRRNASSIRAAWFWRSAAAFRLELRVFFFFFFPSRICYC